MMLEVVSPALQTLVAQPVIPFIAQGTAFICFAFPAHYLRFVATEQGEEPPEISALTLVSKEQQ
jgi:hypothetical protein